MTAKESEVFTILLKNPKATTFMIAARLGVSQQAVSNRIKTLKKKNLLHRIGPPKGGYWEVVSK